MRRSALIRRRRVLTPRRSAVIQLPHAPIPLLLAPIRHHRVLIPLRAAATAAVVTAVAEVITVEAVAAIAAGEVALPHTVVVAAAPIVVEAHRLLTLTTKHRPDILARSTSPERAFFFLPFHWSPLQPSCALSSNNSSSAQVLDK